MSFSVLAVGVRRRRAAPTPLQIPELPEVGAALVGRVLAPEQLARHLVVEPDHVGLDEARVRLEHADRVRRHLVERPAAASPASMSRSGSYIGSGNSGAAMIGSSGSGLSQMPSGTRSRAPIRAGTVGARVQQPRAGSAPRPAGRASRSRGRPARPASRRPGAPRRRPGTRPPPHRRRRRSACGRSPSSALRTRNSCAGACSAASSVSSAKPRSAAVPPRPPARSRSDTRSTVTAPLCTRAVRHNAQCAAREPPQQRRLARALTRRGRRAPPAPGHRAARAHQAPEARRQHGLRQAAVANDRSHRYGGAPDHARRAPAR